MMLSYEERHALIDILRTFPPRLALLVNDLTEEQLTTPYLDGEWTVAQNVHHLVDSHTNAIVRMKRILTEERPTLHPYDQDRWANLPDGNNPQIQNSLRLLQTLHERWVLLFEHLQADEWQRSGLHPEVGEVTIEDMLGSYAQHGEAHMDQITRTLDAQRS